MSVDEKCVALAKHFLADSPGHTPDDVKELAEAFQFTAEQHCAGIEEVAEDRIANKCDHPGWDLQTHGRHCPTCGAQLVDFGD